MEGIITRGTTLRGRHVNEGDRVELDEDDFRKLASTGDIQPIPANEVAEELQEATAVPQKTKSNPKKKK